MVDLYSCPDSNGEEVFYTFDAHRNLYIPISIAEWADFVNGRTDMLPVSQMLMFLPVGAKGLTLALPWELVR